MNTFKRLLKELQFDTELETSAVSVQRLCSIENFNFSNLTRYNSKTGEFQAKQKYTYPIIFWLILISFIRIWKLSFALSVGISLSIQILLLTKDKIKPKHLFFIALFIAIFYYSLLTLKLKIPLKYDNPKTYCLNSWGELNFCFLSNNMYILEYI